MENFPAYPGDPGPVQRIEEGERIGNFYTYEYAGVDDEGSWLIYSKMVRKFLSNKVLIRIRK